MIAKKKIRYLALILMGILQISAVKFNRKVQVIHYTLKTIRIGVIDSGFNSAFIEREVKLCDQGHYNALTDKDEIVSADPHGSIVAQTLGDELKGIDYCLVIVTVGDENMPPAATAKGVNHLAAIGVTLANMSINGSLIEYGEMRAMTDYTEAGGSIFLAAGNKRLNLNIACNSYPTCYGIKGVYTVGALDNGKVASYSNYGARINLWEEGKIKVKGKEWEGTSFATPRALATYVRYLASLQK